MRRAAFFDVDRTLVRVNTGTLYMRWRFGRREARLVDVLRVSAWMMRYTFGLLEPDEVGRRALAMVSGMEEATFRRDCREWYEATVRPHVSAAARREVERRRDAGELVAILSASTPYAVEPLAEELGIGHVLCSKLEVRDGRFTGGCTELCYGRGKVTAAERWAREHRVDLSRSAFYTDSVSDLPMLRRVGEPRVVNPDPRLRLVAAQHGWRTERWR